MSTQSGQNAGFAQSAFQRELAEFIGFIGAPDIDRAIRRVEQKLQPLPAQARQLFGDRFFFHEQFVAFTHGPFPFQLDTSDLRAVRSASLIASVNRIRRLLSAAGAGRLRAMLLDNFRPDRDIRQIEHEIRAWVHSVQKGFNVTFAEFDGLGNFDLLLEKAGRKIEVECKTIAEDAGSQIKFELNVDLTETFRETVQKQRLRIDETGLFTMKLSRPTSECRHLAQQLKDALEREGASTFEGKDFSLNFAERPDWQDVLDAGNEGELARHVLEELGHEARCATRMGNRIFALMILPHKPATLSERVVTRLKEGADQCSGNNPAIVWLHFVGMKETDFVRLARFSSDGMGRGLNAIVANTFHPQASSTNRTHVERVRFGGDPDTLSHRLAFRHDRLLAPAVSAGGPIYDVPIPHSHFTIDDDL